MYVNMQTGMAPGRGALARAGNSRSLTRVPRRENPKPALPKNKKKKSSSGLQAFGQLVRSLRRRSGDTAHGHTRDRPSHVPTFVAL